MTIVSLRGATKAFGATPVLQGIDLETRDGEFLVLVGPSGCGKSTVLRAIAGLEDLDAGEVLIGGERVNDRSPSERGIAMVFQSYALYPQMTVAQNMGFALELAKVPRADIAASVAQAAETLGIAHLLDRRPAALSGGQRQRVAIGRAIVRAPKVFLFDEPLSNLDAALRVKMRYEFASLHRTLGTTMIYVTHDQAEAMTLADRIVVLNGGRVEQVGTPMELYAAPANLFVAGFIGSPAINRLPGTLLAATAQGATIRVGAQTLSAAVDARAAVPGSTVMVGVRSEHLVIAPHGLAARVRFVEALGGSSLVHYVLDDVACDPLVRHVTGAATEAVGDAATLSIAPGDMHVFDAQGAAFPRLTSGRAAA
ncbi:MAG: sn-glycerol-3-phosphate ABC transporter ATP-binding protein UgpC [Sphingomonadales bacterium]|nr:sn-glycerol-3-phosphate ABC transporter ATP-binding protein UgpC [Sphingomonadales bacterium]